MQMDPKKNKPLTNKKKSTSAIITLRKELAQLRSDWMRSEEDRIQLSIRHMDLMNQQSSITATYVGAVRERNSTIQQLLEEKGIEPTTKVDLSDESELRRMLLRTADKAIQTELW